MIVATLALAADLAATTLASPTGIDGRVTPSMVCDRPRCPYCINGIADGTRCVGCGRGTRKPTP